MFGACKLCFLDRVCVTNAWLADVVLSTPWGRTGESEANMRKLFEDAEKDERELGPGSELHVIIFDEIDAICKARGSVQSGGGMHMPAIRVCHQPMFSCKSGGDLLLENRSRSPSVQYSRMFFVTPMQCASACGHFGNAQYLTGTDSNSRISFEGSHD